MDYLHKALDTLSIIKKRTMNAIIIHSSRQALFLSIIFSLIIPTQTGGFDKECTPKTVASEYASFGWWQCVWKFRRLMLLGVNVSLEARYEIRKICHFSYLSLYFLLAVQDVKTQLLFLTEMSSLYHHDSYHL